MLTYVHFLCSVQFSRSVESDSLRPHELQYDRPPCPSPTPISSLIKINSLFAFTHLHCMY